MTDSRLTSRGLAPPTAGSGSAPGRPAIRTGLRRIPCRVLVATILSTIAAAALAGQAQAGTMVLGTCNDVGRATSSSGWRPVSLGSPASGTSLGSTVNTCGQAGGLMSAEVGTDRATNAGVGAGFMFTAPANTRITGIDLSIYSYST